MSKRAKPDTQAASVVRTARMTVTPATAALVGLEMEHPVGLAQALGAEVPANWPPEMLRDALPFFHAQLLAAPELSGWLGWYGVAHNNEDGSSVLAASGGFMGLPVDGSVEIGYSVVPQFQGRGYATEMMAALIHWAWTHPDVAQVAAEALPDNIASRRVLAKLGFMEAGAAHEPGHLRLVLRRP